MRLFVLPTLALLSAAPPEVATLPESEVVALGASEVDTDAVCRDRIHEVREANGQPVLQRETTSPDEAYLIAAVDQRIDGCNVMVMRNDTSDVRPLPKPDDNVRLIPAY